MKKELYHQNHGVLIRKYSQVILENKKFKPKPNAVLIMGFVSSGMVGTITVDALIENLNAQLIGFVLSEELLPISFLYDGFLKHPFRLYYSLEHNIIFSIAETPFTPGSYRELAYTLIHWAIKMKVSEIICIQAFQEENLGSPDPYPVYISGNKRSTLDRLKKIIILPPPRTLILGIESAISNECLNTDMNFIILETPCNPQVPCPEGAVAVLNILCQILNLTISTDKLIAQSNDLKQKLLDLNQKANDVQADGISNLGTQGREHMMYT